MATHCHGYPCEIISHGVWPYHRFSLSLRDVEELLAKGGITVTHESIRQWCRKFGLEYVRKLNRCQGRLGDVWHLDEVSHQPTRQRERQMRGFKSAGQAQRFLSVHEVIRNLFDFGHTKLTMPPVFTLKPTFPHPRIVP